MTKFCEKCKMVQSRDHVHEDEPTERDVVLRIRRAGSIDEAYVLYADRITEARREGAAEGIARLEAEAERRQIPHPAHVALRHDNGYVSMTTLRFVARDLRAAAFRGDA